MKRTLLTTALILLTASCSVATVPSDTARYAGPYACDGSDTTFTFNFGLDDDDDIQVIKITVADGAETPLTKTIHYTVTSANGNDPLDFSGGGTVTTTTAYSSAYKIWLRSDTARTQALNIDDEDVEEALDKTTYIVQDIYEILARCLKVQPSETGTTVQFPPAGTAGYAYQAANGNWSKATPSAVTQAVASPWDSVIAGTADANEAQDARDDIDAERRATYNVKDYGTVGDGVVDDSAAIQAAINAAAASAISGSDAAAVAIPNGVYNLGTTGITVPGYVHLRGAGRPYLLYSGTGFAVTIQGNQTLIDSVIVQVNTAAGQSDYFGGIKIYAAAAQTSKNVIQNCMIQGTNTGSQVDPYGVGIYIAGASETWPSYFNLVTQCVIRRFYRGTLHHDAANANFYSDNEIEYYYKYGVDLAGSDENMMTGCFFQQAAGRSPYDLTYAVHLGATAVLNQLSFGAEPGTYSSPMWCENSGNQVYSVNSNGTYGIENDGQLRQWNTAGDLVTDIVIASEAILVYDASSLSDEMIANGDFATSPDTSWTWGSGWSLASEKAAFAGGSNATLTQALTITARCVYRISITLSGDADAGVQVKYNGTNYFRAMPNATTTKYIVASAAGTTFTIAPSSSFSGSVDDVSVTQIIGGDLTAQGRVFARLGVVEDVNNISADVTAFGTSGTHILDSSGGAIAGTLADGTYVGQTVTFACKKAGNNIDITVAHHVTSDPEVIRLDAAKEAVKLVWDGTDWVEVSVVGAVSYP